MPGLNGGGAAAAVPPSESGKERERWGREEVENGGKRTRERKRKSRRSISANENL